MNKKTLIIIISSIFLVIILIVGIYFYTKIYSTPKTVEVGKGFTVGRPSSGNGTDTTNKNGSSTDGDVIPSTNTLKQISKDPVSGSTFSKPASSTMVIFTDRITGQSLQTDLENINLSQLTNTTVPKIYEAVWSNKANFTVLRYLKDDSDIIQSFIGNISSSSLIGKFLPENITQLAINPSGNKIFYLINSANGSLGYITDPNLKATKQVISSPAKEWIVTWPKDDTLTFTTKASATADGYMFTLNTSTGGFNKILGGLAGLTTLTNSDITKTFYSESGGVNIRSYIYNHKTSEIKSISLSTLPEKCVWSKLNTNNIYCAVPKNIFSFSYPDVWYQGLVSFDDQIWLIKTDTNETVLLNNLSTANTNIDATSLQLDTSEGYLTFINKKDLQLWSLKIK